VLLTDDAEVVAPWLVSPPPPQAAKTNPVAAAKSAVKLIIRILVLLYELARRRAR
jgi:hypothetical protein